MGSLMSRCRAQQAIDDLAGSLLSAATAIEEAQAELRTIEKATVGTSSLVGIFEKAGECLERMAGRRSGQHYVTDEDSDIRDLLDAYSEWKVNK